MRRQHYPTIRARNIDQLKGAGLAFLVNIGLLIGLALVRNALAPAINGSTPPAVSPDLVLNLIPWLVNGALLAVLFLLRPAMGVGYITSFMLTIGVAIGLGVVFFGSCVAGMTAGFALGLIFMPIGRDLGGIISGGVFVIIWIGVFLAGLYALGRMLKSMYDDWWREPPGDGTGQP
jgi:hypothetical protein